MKLQVLYEDNHLIAVSKPAGMLTQGDSSKIPSLLDVTKEWLKDKYQKPGNVFLGLVHRLDRQVPGVVLFAKTSKAASRLSAAFRGRTVEKSYLAVCEPAPQDRRGELTHRLGPLEEGLVHVVSDTHPEGKEARLKYEVKETRGNKALVAIQLLTGRKHQIRVQLSTIGSPIVGDTRYGYRGERSPEVGIALFAQKLSVPHPTREGDWVVIEDPAASTYLEGWW